MVVLGGAGIGLIIGYIFVKAHNFLPTDANIDIVLTLIAPYLLYWVAEEVHASGIM